MNRTTAPLSIIIFAIVFSYLTSTRGDAQVPTPQDPRTQAEREWEARQQREMQKKENAKREQELKKDTDKLLELATALKQSVDKSGENTLSVDVIKKADEIEKLAKAVKEKMKGPY